MWPGTREPTPRYVRGLAQRWVQSRQIVTLLSGVYIPAWDARESLQARRKSQEMNAPMRLMF